MAEWQKQSVMPIDDDRDDDRDEDEERRRSRQ